MYKKIFAGLLRPSRTPLFQERLKAFLSGNDAVKINCSNELDVLLTIDDYTKNQMTLGNICIVLDGFISNRADLISEFVLPEDFSDEQIIAEIYRRFQVSGFEKIAGDYAYVIWDGASSQLFCVRSPLGYRSLFYHTLNDGSIIVSSEISIIKKLSEQRLSLDMEYLSKYIVYMETDCIESPYKNITRLTNGSYLQINKNGVKNNSYWSWEIGKGINGLNSREDYGEAFKDLFYKVIDGNMNTDLIIGAELSGGLDSSSVSCVLRDLLNNSNKSIHTLSQVYDEFKESDERHYIDIVANNIRSIHHPIICDEQWLMKDIEELPEYDEPSTVALDYANAKTILEGAHNNGVQIMFSGTGGDQLLDWQHFFLSDYLTTFRIKSFVKNMLSWTRYKNTTLGNLSFLFVLAPLMQNNIVKKYKKSWQEEQLAFSEFGLFHSIPPWTNEKFVNNMGLIERCATSITFKNNISKSRILKQVKETIRHGWVDKYVATPFKIQRRNPFLDQRLLEFVLSVPNFMFTSPGPIKPLLREAMVDTLPNEILIRETKTHFNGLLFKGINEEFDKIRKLSKNMIAEEIGIINGRKFRESIERWRLGFFGNFGDIVKTLGLELWLRKVLAP